MAVDQVLRATAWETMSRLRPCTSCRSERVKGLSREPNLELVRRTPLATAPDLTVLPRQQDHDPVGLPSG